MKNQFEPFVERLNINPAILSEINSWEHHPNLKKLFNELHSANDQQSFLDHFAEATVARHLLKRGYKLEVEVPTPRGRSVDFRATRDNYSFCVHIKRPNLEGATQKELNVINRIGNLRNISRAIDVRVDLLKRLTDKDALEVHNQLKKFIEKSHIIDKRIIKIKNTDGEILAKCDISPKFKGKHRNVRVCVLPKLWPVRDRERLYEILSNAYKQFMPKSLNVILVTSRLAMVFDNFEKSLSDSPGFWSNDRHPNSYIAGWFYFDTTVDSIKFRIWYRGGYKISGQIRNLFEN